MKKIEIDKANGCSGCVFWEGQPSDVEVQATVGICRRRAPRPVEVRLHKSEKVVYSVWCQTNHWDWCGEGQWEDEEEEA